MLSGINGYKAPLNHRAMDLQNIPNKIYEVRGVKVMIDFDLAKLYDV